MGLSFRNPMIDAKQEDRALTGVTTLIAACTVVGVYLVQAYFATSPLRPLAETVAAVVIALLLGLVARRFSQLPPFVLVGSGAILVALPFVVEFVGRTIFSTGSSLELNILASLRNLTLAALCRPRRSLNQQIVVATSVLVMLIVFLLVFDRWTSLLVFVYAILSIWWLMGRSWSRLQGKTPLPSQREIPVIAKTIALIAALILVLVAGLALRDGGATTALAGFMPSSGGTRWSDPYATGGVKDGDQMVAATDDASSFGPLESELFMESQQPSIYDVFNDLYDEPAKRKKSQARAIPLSPSDSKQNHRKLAENERATREFSAIRRQREHRKPEEKLQDLRSKSLCYVTGRTPLHLAHEVFDTWDGEVLSFQGPAREDTFLLCSIDDQPWVRCGRLPKQTRLFAEQDETRVLRYIHLRTPRVVSPPHLDRIHLDRLHTAKFFRWTSDGLVRFANDDIPRLTVLHTVSKSLRRSCLAETAFERLAPGEVPLSAGVTRLLDDWTRDTTTDWQRIDAVVQGIRGSCRLDAERRVPEDTDDVVEYFLLHAQSGPDYLFAVSAASLLRQLGYRTRVVQGFYARPENYVRDARATAVFAEDAHFWTEVSTTDGVWIPLEPTPGYELLDAPRTARERFVAGLATLAGAIRTHWPMLLCCATAAAALGWFRRPIALWVRTVRWHVMRPSSSRAKVRYVLGLLDAQARLSNQVRPAAWTVKQWVQSIGAATTADAQTLRDFDRLCQWALYGSSPQPPVNNVAELCSRSLFVLRQQMKRKRP